MINAKEYISVKIEEKNNVGETEETETYSWGNATMELVKVHMRRAPVKTLSTWSTLRAGWHNPKNIYIVPINRGSDQKCTTWIKT
jgi:hypothetical protein